MRRFLRHPIHRTAVVALTTAALLGYFVPALITNPGPVNASVVAISVLAILVYSWSVLRGRTTRRDGTNG